MKISESSINRIVDLVRELISTDDSQLARLHSRLWEEKEKKTTRSQKFNGSSQTEINDSIEQQTKVHSKGIPIELVSDDLLNDLETSQSNESVQKKKTSKTVGTKKCNSTKKEKKVWAEKKQKGLTAIRAKNPYFEFLSSERESIKADLLAKNLELKGRDLTTSIAKEAGRRWNEMSGESKQCYSHVKGCHDDSILSESFWVASEILEQHLSPCCDDKTQTEVDHVEEEEEEDRIYNESLSVWIDTETQLYFDSKDSNMPLGQIARGKTVVFKTVAFKTKKE
jgi:hypothetical protein